ncbi:50S ribosomal protein L18 [candidate division WS5 bacterium]|uniref:Large ribosomal subunit protein uL18 n=1 Tax=candidate division WS5 bacterium TaxID=2093353 RepID=A0A419DAJ8_9BACT|nr:MAG: 50S ribosomal protein L18 [candidate division WS5 bacterium]
MAKVKKAQNKESRQRRIRAKVSGSSERPRLSVSCSNKHIFVQIIDDTKGRTIVSASDLEKGLKNAKGTKSEAAKAVGLKVAQKAKDKKIKRVVFDRGGKLYHGRIKAVAEGAREGGLEF